jgi:hypothetical protein
VATAFIKGPPDFQISADYIAISWYTTGYKFQDMWVRISRMVTALFKKVPVTSIYASFTAIAS